MITQCRQKIWILSKGLDNKTFDSCLNIISSHTNMTSVPVSKNLRRLLKKKYANVSFIRLASPVINMEPRNELLGNVPELSSFNKTSIMAIRLLNHLGFNYLGKITLPYVAVIMSGERMNQKYDMNLVYFETTSLYGSSKSSSQYDGMKTYFKK